MDKIERKWRNKCEENKRWTFKFYKWSNLNPINNKYEEFQDVGLGINPPAAHTIFKNWVLLIGKISGGWACLCPHRPTKKHFLSYKGLDIRYFMGCSGRFFLSYLVLFAIMLNDMY